MQERQRKERNELEHSCDYFTEKGACIVALSAMSATLDKVSIGQMSVLVRGQLAIIYWLNSTSDCNH